jgi:anti-anti-sigma factor
MIVNATADHEVITRLGITYQELDGVQVVSVGGELDGWTAPALREQIAERLDQPVLLDLSELQFCDSSGLRGLLALTDDADLLMVAPQRPEVARVFTLTGADASLPLTADALGAVERLSPPSS